MRGGFWGDVIVGLRGIVWVYDWEGRRVFGRIFGRDV